MQSLTLLNFTMAEIVLDANVIVALLYADDSQHLRAIELGPVGSGRA